MSTRPKVILVQRIVPHYRVELFRRLWRQLHHCGIDCRLIYGQERAGTIPRGVHIEEPWAIRTANRYYGGGAFELCWQSEVRKLCRDADLVVIEQANRLLVNYLLHGRRLFGRQLIAYWGHGANLQTQGRVDLREAFKRRLVGHVDWWFAYTSLSRRLVERTGFPPDRITVVQNAIDTSVLKDAIGRVTAFDLAAVRAKLKIGSGPVGVFCGGMYEKKQLPFLIAAADVVRKDIGDFELILVGDGPDQGFVEMAAKTRPWVHYVGAAFGSGLAPYLAVSSLILMPGLVGLAIVDSFVVGRPMFTTDVSSHSPEIEYLEHGVNGWLTKPDINEYASAIVEYLRTPQLQISLKAGAAKCADEYTLDSMVERFSQGVLQCLERAGKR